MSYDLAIKSVYDINLRASAILGTGFKAATIQGLLDFDSANQIEDVTAIHAQIFSLLPPGTPRKASELIYVKIATSTGEVRVIAMDWISEQPELVVSTTANVVIANMNLSDLDLLRQVLVSNGFRDITITTLEAP